MRISAFNRSCERKQSHMYPGKSLKKVAISFDHDPILFSSANPADEVFGRHRPLSADAFEDQMFYLASRGYRCIAHDRRGHGRSSQPWTGNDMDTYADNLAELVQKL